MTNLLWSRNNISLSICKKINDIYYLNSLYWGPCICQRHIEVTWYHSQLLLLLLFSWQPLKYSQKLGFSLHETSRVQIVSDVSCWRVLKLEARKVPNQKLFHDNALQCTVLREHDSFEQLSGKAYSAIG